MRRHGKVWRLVVGLATVFILLPFAVAHPGSAIFVDRQGQIYFIDTGAGLWKIDTHGVLTKLPGPNFHWMALDPDNHFSGTALPSNSEWEFQRTGASPTVLFSSDFPIVMGQDGNLYYPAASPGGPLQILRMAPTGKTSVLTTLPGSGTKPPPRWLNGITLGPDGSLYYTENDAIRRVTMQGVVTTAVEGVTLKTCGAVPDAEAEENNRPYLRGLAVASNGDFYVAASGCASLLKISTAGKISILLQLQSPWSPTAVALHGSDVYVLEYLHTATEERRKWVPRVRKITPDGRSAILAAVTRN